MEIHKPKAVHGWREFFNEIGIIVIGVLIALGAEQLVETVHWHHAVTEQRRSLTDEIKANLDSVARRAHQQPCVDRRLTDIHSVLERHAHGQPVGIIGEFAYPTRAGASRGSWDIALAGQALSHMSQDDRLTFSATFGVLTTWQQMTDQERAIWARLSMLNDPALLSETDWSAVRTAYVEAVDMNNQRRDLAGFILQGIGHETSDYKPSLEASNPTYAALDRQICSAYIR